MRVVDGADTAARACKTRQALRCVMFKLNQRHSARLPELVLNPFAKENKKEKYIYPHKII
jgi:hypothetical protein